MKDSRINWTRHTFNPWLGCTKVSAGCKNCYAESWSARYHKDIWGPGKPRQRTSADNWKQPLKWDRLSPLAGGERDRLFCASLADVFDPEVPEAWRDDLWNLIARTRNLDWLILTKRPQLAARNPGFLSLASREDSPIWIGVSAEPLLAPIDIAGHGTGYPSWVIVGGESGPGHRDMQIQWAWSLRDQCAAHSVACWMKQLGGPAYNKRDQLDPSRPSCASGNCPSPPPS